MWIQPPSQLVVMNTPLNCLFNKTSRRHAVTSTTFTSQSHARNTCDSCVIVAHSHVPVWRYQTLDLSIPDYIPTSHFCTSTSSHLRNQRNHRYVQAILSSNKRAQLFTKHPCHLCQLCFAIERPEALWPSWRCILTNPNRRQGGKITLLSNEAIATSSTPSTAFLTSI